MFNRVTNPSGCLVLACVAAIVVAWAGSASAQEIWSGSGFSFTKPHGADWTLEANQDRITPDTWITRKDDRGWFNIRVEAEYDLFGAQLAPANTEWAYDLPGNGNDGQLMAATNFANLTFEVWKASVNSFPPGAVNLPAVLHLISEDIYIDITVTQWLGQFGGGFSYDRAIEPAPEPSAMLLHFSALIALAGLHRVRGQRGA